MNIREILIAEAVYYHGNWEEIVNAIRKRELLPTKDIVEIYNKLQKLS